MLSFLYNYSIGKRNLIGFTITQIFLVIISIMSLISIGVLAEKIDELYEKPYTINSYSLEIINGFNTLEKEMYKFILTNSSTDVLPTTASLLSYLSELELLTSNDTDYEAHITQLKTNLKDLKPIREQIAAASLAGDNQKAAHLASTQYFTTVVSAQETAGELKELADFSAAQFLKQANILQTTIIALTVLFVGISLYCSIYLALYITKSIDTPIKKLITYLQHFSQGDLSQENPIVSNDEIGVLSQTLAETMGVLNHYIDATSHTLKQMAIGDMTSLPNTLFIGDFKPIQDSLIHLTTTFNDLLRSLQLSTGTVSEHAVTVLSETQSFNNHITMHHHLTSSMKDEVTSLIESIRENTDQAEYALTVSSSIQEKTKTSQEEIITLTQSSKEVELAYDALEQITAAIKDIAKQTHMISLNASIEASRLGEKGNSFSVIATEMCTLAIQCQEAASQSSSLIAKCKRSTSANTHAIAHYTEHFATILQAMTTMHDNIENIVHSIQIQNTSLEETLSTIDNLVKTTSHMTAFADQNTENASLLTSQAQELESRFTLFYCA